MKQTSVTLKDVAARAGVSHVTVSGVLGGSRANNSRVSPATRERILDAARQLRYRPNETARALQRRRTNMIGFYEGHPSPLYILHAVGGAVLGGLQVGCGESGIDLILYGGVHRLTAQDAFPYLADGRVDGLIVWAEPGDFVVQQAQEAGIPMVAIIDALPGIPSVVVDDAAGGRLLAEHLAQRGHRHVSFCPRADSVSVGRRFAAFRQATEERGMRFTVCSSSSPSPFGESEPDMEWMRTPRAERPTAIAAAFDLAADVFIARCAERGLTIPDDLAIVGFDGVAPVRPSGLRLTTIRAPWTQMAATAVRLLNQRINGEEITGEIILPVELLPGDSA